MPGKKFCRVDRYLRIAVGLELGELPEGGVAADMPRIADVRPYTPRGALKVYLDLSGAGLYPRTIAVRIPSELNGAPWGEVLFNNNHTGAQVLFGREGEDMPFGPTEGKYVILRLYRETDVPFKTVYARVDHGPDTRFFSVNARWEDDLITIEIDQEPERVPSFLE